MKLRNSPGGVNNRRIKARIRLNVNLADQTTKHKALTDKAAADPESVDMADIIQSERELGRMKSEITTLNARIVPEEMAYLKKNKKFRGAR